MAIGHLFKIGSSRAATEPSLSRRAKRRNSAASNSVWIASGAPLATPPEMREATEARPLAARPDAGD
jgi:hypothetical protein